jgi:hypothetical protein
MRIPKKLKVGGVVYEVRIVKMKDAAEVLRGCNIIKINEKLSQENREEALIHECLHIICWEMKDERVIEMLSQGIYQVMKDNNLFSK